MIDPLTEQVISLTDAAKACPKRRSGKRPHVSCLYRWTTSGCRGEVLESIQIGGTRCTSREGLSRFFARLTDSQRHKLPQSSLLRREDAAAIDCDLDAAGLR